jgi:hypothetical protein
LAVSDKKAKKYKQAIDVIFSSSDRDRVAAYDAVLDAYSDGTISKIEAGFFQKLIGTKKDIEWNSKSGIFQSAINFVKSSFGAHSYAQDDATDALRNMMVKIQNGAEPTIAARDVVKERLQRDHPGMVVDDKVLPSAYGKGGFVNTVPTPQQPKASFVYSKGKGISKKEESK